MYTKNFVNPCPDWATALLNGFSQVLLQRNPLCGLLCLLAILITAPELIGGALLGALAGLLTAQRRGYNRADRQAGLERLAESGDVAAADIPAAVATPETAG